ncbi:MFS transporter [Planomonospora sp. ID67723]|uniref:MFS transporter n=1 Tax=Planomonospora sp. ID67723 TaxID=2738134 RepID=UPI0018C40213|nr:MFS transporter [Planomonospora sp. ID67723]MBG0829281.1 MFS transporter [Planomonospora sp. ID67723]
MAIEPYRRLLALPGVRTLLLVGLLARIPSTAVGLTLTLHIRGLGLGWFEAGAVGTATTVGMAVGSPLAGRFVDRYGLRPVLLVTGAAQLVFWTSAWALPYLALVVASVAAGLLALPVFGVIRQCLAAVVPVEQRRTGFSLDSMLVELAYMTGPAFAAAGTVALGSTWTMCLVAVGLAGSAAALILLDPPVRSDEEEERPEKRVPRGEWLTPGLVTLLGTASAATFVLIATELSLVATMERTGDTAWIGVAIGGWCLYSLIGGFVYGGLSRGFSPLVLIGAMGLFTVPVGLVGLVGGGWGWLVAALIPAGVLCAPGLSSTVEAVSRRVPAGARGEAMGLHGTALLVGGALAAPVAGAVIDGAGPGWVFVTAGLVSVVMVLVALPFWRRSASRAEAPQPVAV